MIQFHNICQSFRIIEVRTCKKIVIYHFSPLVAFTMSATQTALDLEVSEVLDKDAFDAILILYSLLLRCPCSLKKATVVLPPQHV